MARYCIVFHTDKKLKLRRRFLDEALFLCGLFCGRRRAAGCLRRAEYILCRTAAPAPAETPATGDFPVMYLAGVVGLILICSAGLLMLRKI